MVWPCHGGLYFWVRNVVVGGVPYIVVQNKASENTFLLTRRLPRSRARHSGVLVTVVNSNGSLRVSNVNNNGPLADGITVVDHSDSPHTSISCLFTRIVIRRRHISAAPGYNGVLSNIKTFTVRGNLVTTASPIAHIHVHGIGANAFVRTSIRAPGNIIRCRNDTEVSNMPNATTPITLAFLGTTKAGAKGIFPASGRVSCFSSIPIAYVSVTVPIIVVPTRCLKGANCRLPTRLSTSGTLLTHVRSVHLRTNGTVNLNSIDGVIVPGPILVSPTRGNKTVGIHCFVPRSYRHTLTVANTVTVSDDYTLRNAIAQRVIPSMKCNGVGVRRPDNTLSIRLDGRNRSTAALHTSIVQAAEGVFSNRICLP